MSLSILIEEKQILVDGLKVNYKKVGVGDKPIILLHGWGINSDKYIETAKQLVVADPAFSIFVPDLPGFGKSDNSPEAWNVGDYVEFIKKFVDILNFKKIILIGHSFGGRVAIKFSVKYPEVLKALIMTGAAGIKHSPAIKQKIFFILAKVGKIFFSLPLLNNLEKAAQKILYKAAREKDYYKSQGVMKETFKKVIDEDLAIFLDKIKIPTLLVWGVNDKSTPLADGKLMCSKIINCKLEILDDCDHRAPYQFPEKFAKIIVDFIHSLGKLQDIAFKK